ncbi:complex I NDUFA9 subunit family protein [Sphingobium sp. DEHP117]|uniref:complex I NDUFA9 subunit family protein n=1 Tax=Sphingobium sp. DEHP117 TaxID=2993436 RepID=UPI0027D72021|nr:NAD-dependent epimerase/dehydratase family protein [Sphingobium sp. DEHP117]MDQ4419516.1 complex I NDUFA9 subunit family protein [Sphingobium sp. DEHP117]
MLVTVFGGGGFLGRYVAQELLGRGFRVRVAEREPANALRVKPLGNLGQSQLVHADVRNPASVARAVAGADAVVNLVAVLKGDMDGINHIGAANVAKAAAEAGVTTLVHISAIGSDAQSQSAYGRSKGQGEQAVRAAVPAATLIRPSILFGREDQFTNPFANLIRMAPVLPIIAGETKFQPVYVVDVARAIATAVADAAAHAGKTYELGGPQVLSMAQINAWLADAIGHKPAMFAMPACASEWLARLTGWLPAAPITLDQWRMLQVDNVVDAKAKGLADLGIAPTPLAAVADQWLVQYRKHGRFTARAKA